MTGKSLTFRDLIEILGKRKRAVVGVLVLMTAPMVAYNELSTPVYMAKAKIVFENYPTGATIGADFISPLARQNYIANRLEEMKTLTFVKKVASSLPDSIVYRILATEDSSKIRNPRTYPIGYIRRGLDARLVQGTDVVEVTFESTDPRVAAAVTNAAVDVLRRSNLEQRRQEYTALRSFADEQLAVVERRLRQAEEALRNFKEREGVVTLDTEASEILERMTQAEVLLNNIRSEIQASERKLAVLRQQIETEKKDLPETVTSITTPMTEKLKQRLVELETTYAKLQAQNYPEDHPKMVEIRNDIEQTKASLVEETMRIVQDEKLSGLVDPLEQIGENLKATVALEVEIQGLKAQSEQLQKLMDGYEQRLRKLPDQEVTLVRLQRELEVNNKLYQTLYEERERARIREAAEIGTMRIMERAIVPSSPVRPRKMLNLLISIFAGLTMGVILAVILEYLYDKPQSAEDVQTFTQLPVLASIPKARNGMILDPNHGGDGKAQKPGRGARSALSDAYDLLWSSLTFSLDPKAKILEVTSSIPGEGKSTVALNLAVLSARRGMRTILVDGDLRKPMLHRYLEVPRQPGLSELQSEIREVLSERKVVGRVLGTVTEEVNNDPLPGANDDIRDLGPLVDAFLAETPIDNLRFLPAGSLNVDSTSIWFSYELDVLLRILRTQADIVVLDMPPCLGLADANVASRHVDAVLFCIASGETERRAIQRALANLQKVDAKIIGIVVNKVDQTFLYGSRKYYRYYTRYYTEKDA